MAAAHKKPTALKKLLGNPGCRPLPQWEAQPEIGANMPEDLSHEAAEHWPHVAKELAACGLLTRVDRVALGLYCETYARWKNATDIVVRDGAIITTGKGFPMQSPYLGIANRAQDQLVKLLTEFGMTPASRSKVHAAPIANGKKNQSEDEPDTEDYFT